MRSGKAVLGLVCFFLLAYVGLIFGATDSTGQEYKACGCGCCGGTEPAGPATCVSDAEALQKIIDADKEQAKSKMCAVAGCAMGKKYRVCTKKDYILQKIQDIPHTDSTVP